MPKVLEDRSLNLYVYIYLSDHLPSHVHVHVGPKKTRGQANIKIDLGDSVTHPRLVKISPAISKAQAVSALALVAEKKEYLLEKWREIHGEKGVGT